MCNAEAKNGSLSEQSLKAKQYCNAASTLKSPLLPTIVKLTLRLHQITMHKMTHFLPRCRMEARAKKSKLLHYWERIQRANFFIRNISCLKQQQLMSDGYDNEMALCSICVVCIYKSL